MGREPRHDVVVAVAVDVEDVHLAPPQLTGGCR